MWGRKYRLVRQNDQADCGPAALATLARHHGLSVNLEYLRHLSHTDRDGASLFGLRQAAELLGFSAKAVRLPAESLATAPLPAIAHLTLADGAGHYVVLFRVARRSVVIGDPAGGIETLPMEKFLQRWSGNLLLAVPDGVSKTNTHPRPASPIKQFLHLLTPHRALIGEVVLCALLMALLAVSTSYFVQHLIDSVLVHSERTLLNACGVGMLLIVLLRTAFGAARQYLLAFMGRRIDLILIGGYSRHILRLPVQFFHTRRVGEIFSRVGDADKLRDAISGATTTAIVDGTVVVALLTLLWCYDLPLAAAATLIVPVFLGAIALNHSAIARHSRASMERGSLFAAHLVEDISGVETIKACDAQSMRSDRTEAHLVSFIQSMFSLAKLDVWMTSLSTLISGLAGVAILWLGGHRVLTGAITIGQLLFFYTLVITMLEPLGRLASVNLKIHEALSAVERLFQILDLEVEPIGYDQAPFTHIRREIQLQNVSFGYGSKHDVLEQVNLTIPSGKMVAIVGESGSGKSTLLKLLLRFHSPSAGQILVDGVDLRDFALGSLRNRLGVVTQDAYVFTGSIRENISLGSPQATLTDVIAAAKAAGLDAFINTLPLRYDTMVGERGSNLSGGQRQRLAIARALVGHPEMLIFDEATSQLDTATERQIQENLRKTLAGRTVLVVAHRLSTIMDADLIYVMQSGRVAECGSHGELLAAGGAYAKLWESQTTSLDGLFHLPPALNGRALANRISHAFSEG
ncbi:MAG: peptidase domain-containing ABC transporter [Planctomycetaceae bacterium]|nr:peptidase domain-containing ABC transporter [Planctomycetaceae bacterium]